MRNISIRLILILIFILPSLHGQWVVIGSYVDEFDFSSPGNGYYLSVTWWSPSSGYSTSGARTQNYGNNWNPISTPYTAYNASPRIFAFEGDTCFYYESDNGNIRRSVNGGQSWEYHRYTGQLTDISLISSSVGYGVRRHWEGNIRELFRIDGRVAEVLWRTDTADFNRICFLDDSTGFLMGHSDRGYEVYRTYSPSAQWDKVFSHTGALNHLTFSNDSTGFLVGDSGLIMRTRAHGDPDSWMRMESNTLVNLNYIDYVNQNELYCAGDSGLVLFSDDGGDSWREFRSPGEHPLKKIQAFPGELLYAMDTERILYKHRRPLEVEASETAKNSCLNFSPNPFNQYVFIENPSFESKTIKIFSQDGSFIFQRLIAPHELFEMNTESWKSGMYIVVILGEQGCSHNRLIKL